ncbi:MAG: MobF family relaxase, partial [Pseudomonadota bacterium]
MLSTNTVSPGAAASGYYKAEGYYKAGTDEAEASAQWFGRGASEIGLKGHVDDITFAKLLEGEAPNGQLMGRYRGGERDHRRGEDLTFSAPKSVSYAALVLGDERLIQAHDKAVRSAMEFAEKNFINTRRVVNGEIVTERATKVIAGLFRHDTSRALDPQLHTHAVIANMVRQTGDDTYRAILNDDLRRNLKKIDAVYKNTLA